jgi:serine/threonine protein kinase
MRLPMDELDSYLTGRVLPDGWTILGPRFVQRDAPSASRTYIARSEEGQMAFVKLLDPSGHASLDEQQLALEQFRYEKRLAEKCRDRKMRRVIRILGDGELIIDGTIPVRLRYLVLEWADCDVRSQLQLDEPAHLAASLRWLHHMATALQELHFSKISHHDIKPANVLIMPNRAAKLGDLGRAFDHEQPRPTPEQYRDATWAPLEVLYGQYPSSLESRCAADMYQLGSTAVFLFVNSGLTVQIERRLPALQHWMRWTGPYDDLLPDLRDYHDAVMCDFAQSVPIAAREQLTTLIRHLTDPDPRLRGHPGNVSGGGAKYGFERFVSAFNVMAARAEFSLARAV